MVLSKWSLVLGCVLAVGAVVTLQRSPAGSRDGVVPQRAPAKPAVDPRMKSPLRSNAPVRRAPASSLANRPAAAGYSLDNDVFIDVPFFGADLPEGEPQFHSTEIADVTGDGRNDLIVLGYAVSNTAEAELLVYAQKAGGTLAFQQHYPSQIYSPIGTAVGDFNEDGVSDVIVIGAKNFELHASKRGGGLQRTGFPIFDPIELATEVPAIPMDVNADGHLDLVFYLQRTHAGSSSPTTDTHSRVLILYGDGLGGFPTRYSFKTYGIERHDAEKAYSLATGDLNHDGRPDLAVSVTQYDYSAQAQFRLVRVFTNDGAGKLAPGFNIEAMVQMAHEGAGYDVSLYYIGIGDFNGDGMDDIAGGAAAMDLAIQVFHQTRPGVFDFDRLLLRSEPIGIAFDVADLDRNGRDDLVIGHDGWERITYYVQDRGQLTGPTMRQVFFGPRQFPVAARINQTSVAIGDLNGDHCPDAAVTVQWFGLRILRGTRCGVPATPVVCRTQAPRVAPSGSSPRHRVSSLPQGGRRQWGLELR